jgi:hypothetical protein
MKHIKKLMAILALSANISTNGYAANGAVELMSGNQSSTLEAKLSVPLTEKSFLFIRNRNNSDYQKKASHFTLADLGYGLGEGIDAFGETQFNEGLVNYRAGLQYFKKSGDFSIVIAPTMSLDKKKDVTTQIILKYNPEMGKNLKLLTQLEILSSFWGGDHLSSIERARLGLEKKGYSLGVALDTNQIGNSQKTYSNFGGFLGVKF